MRSPIIPSHVSCRQTPSQMSRELYFEGAEWEPSSLSVPVTNADEKLKWVLGPWGRSSGAGGRAFVLNALA